MKRLVTIISVIAVICACIMYAINVPLTIKSYRSGNIKQVSETNVTTNEVKKYPIYFLFNIATNDNMQGLTYNNKHYYVSFDMENGYGKIRKYSMSGKLEKESDNIK